MLKGIVTGIALVGAAARADAAPVYLQCLLTGGGNSGDVEWNVTLNEETSMASWTIPSIDVAESARAVFTPNEVRWNGSIATFTINRTDLVFTRSIGGGTPHVTSGRCRIAPPQDRAF